MIQLEIEEIAQRLPQAGNVLDAGCANGYSTQQILGKIPGLNMTGVDFAPAMISEALKREQEAGSGITYQVGDIRKLPFDNGSFDAAYTTRTIINLSTWAEQVQALKEMVRVVRLGGLPHFGHQSHQSQALREGHAVWPGGELAGLGSKAGNWGRSL